MMAVTHHSLFYSMVIQTAGSSWPRFVLSLFVVLIILHWSNGQGQGERLEKLSSDCSVHGDFSVHCHCSVYGDYSACSH